MKIYEELKEMLQDEVGKITKKGDITPGELENVYKAMKTIKSIEEISAMEEYSNDYSQRNGNSNNSYHMPYYMYDGGNSRRGSYDGNSSRGSYDGGSYRGSYDGSYDGGSYDGSYDGYRGNSNDGRRGRDGDSDGRYSEESSYRRGSRGRYSRDGSKDQMIQKLQMMMQEASSEKERQAIQQCMDQLQG